MLVNEMGQRWYLRPNYTAVARRNQPPPPSDWPEDQPGSQVMLRQRKNSPRVNRGKRISSPLNSPPSSG